MEQARIIHAHTTYHTANTFRCAKSFADFEKLAAGDLIGWDGDEEIRAQEGCVIIFARNTNDSDAEAFVLGSEQ